MGGKYLLDLFLQLKLSYQLFFIVFYLFLNNLKNLSEQSLRVLEDLLKCSS